MKYLFFVQSEGRGHMSQALALKERLKARGHEIIGATASCEPDQELPGFFKDGMNCPIINIKSPKFLIDKKGKGIKLVPSIFFALKNIPLYLKSLKKIRQAVTDLNPDVLVNFYEPQAGNYYRFYRDKRPMFSIGHQYLIAHPNIKFKKLGFLNKLFFNFYNRLTAGGRSIKIALSFTDEPDIKNKKLFVCPPLIRYAIKKSPVSKNPFILSYMINAGYSEEIIDWHKANPAYKIEAFWNKPGAPETKIDDNLIFYRLSGQKFIDLMAACESYVGTAGFDSVAEAAYLQKNILLIPTKNQFEQEVNAYDAERAKIAISSKTFNLSLLFDQTKTHPSVFLKNFKEWVDDYDDKIIKLLTD